MVGLTQRRDMLIRHLSGGQVKRASLANELVARPSLLFLDEVTSGLDEQTDREVMELFRQVADGGKTVVCITHSLANVEATCHLVVILTEGGRLAFVGTPEEAQGVLRDRPARRRLPEARRANARRVARPVPSQPASTSDTSSNRMPSDSGPDEGAAARPPARPARAVTASARRGC